MLDAPYRPRRPLLRDQRLPGAALARRAGPGRAGWDSQRPLINGGSVIIGPLGDVLAGPLHGQTGLLTARIDTAELVRARYDFDVSGHYARPDIFSLTVDERARPAVRYLS